MNHYPTRPFTANKNSPILLTRLKYLVEFSSLSLKFTPISASWLYLAALSSLQETFVAYFFCSRAINRRTLLLSRNRKPIIRGTQSLLVKHHPIKQQGGRRIATSVVIRGKVILLQKYKPALTTILHHEMIAATAFWQNPDVPINRHREIILDGLPGIIAPLVFSSAVKPLFQTGSAKPLRTTRSQERILPFVPL